MDRLIRDTLIVSAIISTPFFIKVAESSNDFITKSLIIIFLEIVISILIYLSLSDLESQTVSASILIFLLVFISISISILCVTSSSLEVWNNFTIEPFEHIQGGLILGLIILIGVLISKEKAIGSADVFLGAITGLLVGIDNLLIWFYITIISGTIFALVKVVKLKKMKGQTMPLIPFITIGIILTLLLSSEIKEIFTTITYR